MKKKIILALFGFCIGLFLCIIFLELGMRIAGVIFLYLQEHRNITSIEQKGGYRIMCLGACNTALGGKDSYPAQLEKILNARNLGIRFVVIDKGVPGVKLSYILALLEDNLNRYNPQMVIITPEEIENDNIGGNFSRQIQSSNKEKLIHKDIFASVALSTIRWFNRLRIYNLARRIWLDIGKEKVKNEKLDYRQAKELFKKAIKLNPKDELAYVNLGLFYKSQGEFPQAKELFKKAIKLNPKNELGYIYLGQCYKEEGNLKQAEELFKKNIQINGGSGFGYVELAKFYDEQGKYLQSKEAFKKALEVTPGNYFLYFEASQFYKKQGDLTQAKKFFEKAIELRPGEASAYLELGRCYKEEGKFIQAEELFKRTIGLTPLDDLAYLELGWLYRDQGSLVQAEEVFKKALVAMPRNSKIYRALASLYKEMNKNELADEYDKKTKQSELEAEGFSAPILLAQIRDNYLKIKEILDKRGIKLVCVQYPLHNVESLKKIFEGQIGVIFVDNEKIFKDAVKERGYREYFEDMSGGDTGRYARKGSRLLAENIANTILKEVFNK